MAPRILLLALLAAAPAAALADHGGALHASAPGAFAGPAVVEVTVRDPAISHVGSPAGEPRVEVAGRPLRMAQGADGGWYGYFADLRAASAADASSGAPGRGLDFGTICGPGTPPGALGVDVSAAAAVAVPRTAPGGPAAGGPPAACSGPPGGPETGNVVRSPPRLSQGGGQVGVDPAAWPLVQLYELPGDVVIEYDAAGGAESLALEYGGDGGAELSLDREQYPRGAEVILALRDPALNVDPTDRDSWTFALDAPGMAFYMAFGPRGGPAAAGGPGLADAAPLMRRLGAGGALTASAGGVIATGAAGHQPAASVSDGASEHARIATLVETGRSTGEFTSYSGGRSVLRIAADAPRGAADAVSYGGQRASVVHAPSAASVSLGPPAAAPPGAGPPAAPAPPAAGAAEEARAAAGAWAAGLAPPSALAAALGRLAGEGALDAPAGAPGGPLLPPWTASLAGWWAEGRVSDAEFYAAVEYLAGRGAIRL